MPAIDNTLVREQAAELAELYNSPQELIRSLGKILEQHADPTLRQSLVVSINAPLSGYGIPQPVLRAILGQLRKQVRKNLDCAFELSEVLWTSGSREERWLAGELLSLCTSTDPGLAEEILNRWRLDLQDAGMADALGLSAGAAILRLNTLEHLSDVRVWLHAGHRWTRRFGLAALVGLVQSGDFRDGAAILETIKTSMSESDTEVRSAVAWLLRELTLVSPLDVVRFLRDWANSMNRQAHWIIRHSLSMLDSQARSEIQLALRGSG